MKRIVIGLVALMVIIVAVVLFIENKPEPTQKVDISGLTFDISKKWEPGERNGGEKYDRDYVMDYTYKDSTIEVLVYYADEVDLYDIKANACSGYEGSEDTNFSIAKKVGASVYSFPNRDYVHITTPDKLYILTFDFQNDDIPDKVENILKTIKVETKDEDESN